MAVPMTRPIFHTQTTHSPGGIQRSPSPWFAPMPPTGEREPGTNYLRIITAPGPHTTEHP